MKIYISNRITIILSLIIFSSFTSWAQLPCGQDINFSTWNQEGSPSSGQWIVNGTGNSVNQLINGTSTWFVSPNDFFNVLIQGTIQVNTSNDDDLVGFVFGYQNPIGTLTNPSSTYLKTYIFDWKQSTQTFVGLTSNEGYALYEMDGLFNFNNIVSFGGGVVFPELWERVNSPNLTVLDTDYGNNGWNDFQQYTFQLKYTADSIVIWVDGIKIFEESGCHEPGRFGFYNHSQDDVTYSNFSYTFEYDFSVDDTLICTDDSAQFQIGSGCTNFFPSSTSFLWDFGDGTTAQGIDPFHQYPNPGVYNVQLVSIDQFGCTDTATQSIQVSGYPSANAGTDDFSCSLNYILNAGNNNGIWSSLNGPILASPNSPICNVNVPSEGNYSFVWTVTNPAGCSDSDTITVHFTELNASVVGINPLCTSSNNGQITLSTQGGIPPYSYSWGSSSNNQTSNPAVNLSAGAHSVTITDAQGCTLDTTIILNSPPPFSFSTTINPTNCDSTNGEIIINGLAGGVAPYTFNWGAGQTTSNTIQNLSAGSYTVSISDANNCDTTLILVVPIIPFTGVINSITNVSCFGDSDGSATVSGPNPSGIYTYQWDVLSGSSTTQTVNNLGAGNYSVIVSYSITCFDTLLITIVEPPLLEISIIEDTFICEGNSLILFSNAIGGTPGYAYNWNNSLGAGQNHTISPIQNSTYTCTITDANGCTSIDSTTIEVRPNPVFSSSIDTNQACLYPVHNFHFTVNSTDSLNYAHWAFGDGTSAYGNNVFHSYNSPGNYEVSLQVDGANGCQSTISLTDSITIHPNPVADFIYAPFHITTLYTTINFIDLSLMNITEWNWSFGNNNHSQLENPSFTFPQVSGSHQVILDVENEFGCKDSISKIITIYDDVIIYAPNSFTPDGNEHNQSWFVTMSGIDIYSVEISIFNRWGEQIWLSNDINVPWDGTYQGVIVPDGTYVWKVTAKDILTDKKYEFNGHVNVLR